MLYRRNRKILAASLLGLILIFPDFTADAADKFYHDGLSITRKDYLVGEITYRNRNIVRINLGYLLGLREGDILPIYRRVGVEYKPISKLIVSTVFQDYAMGLADRDVRIDDIGIIRASKLDLWDSDSVGRQGIRREVERKLNNGYDTRLESLGDAYAYDQGQLQKSRLSEWARFLEDKRPHSPIYFSPARLQKLKAEWEQARIQTFRGSLDYREAQAFHRDYLRLTLGGPKRWPEIDALLTGESIKKATKN